MPCPPPNVSGARAGSGGWGARSRSGLVVVDLGLKDKLCVWGGLVPCVVVGGGVVEFVPGDCVAPSGETSLGDV